MSRKVHAHDWQIDYGDGRYLHYYCYAPECPARLSVDRLSWDERRARGEVTGDASPSGADAGGSPGA